MLRANSFAPVLLFLLAIAAGCSRSKPSTKSNNENEPAQPNSSVSQASKEDKASEKTDKSDKSKIPSTEKPKSKPAQPKKEIITIESATLKQAMIDVMTEYMKIHRPAAKPEEIQMQVENAILRNRKEAPEFLMVSAETENQLQAGKKIESAAKRIADAETLFGKARVEIGGLMQFMLTKYKAKNLKPVRIELLAQMMTADMQKIQKSLVR